MKPQQTTKQRRRPSKVFTICRHTNVELQYSLTFCVEVARPEQFPRMLVGFLDLDTKDVVVDVVTMFRGNSVSRFVTLMKSVEIHILCGNGTGKPLKAAQRLDAIRDDVFTNVAQWVTDKFDSMIQGN